MATKTAAKLKKAKAKAKVELYLAKRIKVEDLRVDMRIVTSFHGTTKDGPSFDNETIERLFNLGYGGVTQFVNRSVNVRTIDLCEGKWRTHIHVNGTDCYDTRQTVQIVGEKVEV
jgi:hypothetical protein